MFNNGLNQDTVLLIGLSGGGWLTTERVCFAINQAGYAITIQQTEALLFALASKGKITNDFITLAAGEQYNIWKRPNR